MEDHGKFPYPWLLLRQMFQHTGKRSADESPDVYKRQMLLVPLENGKDCLDNMHANTQIPKVIGYQRIAELAHDVQYHNALSLIHI